MRLSGWQCNLFLIHSVEGSTFSEIYLEESKVACTCVSAYMHFYVQQVYFKTEKNPWACGIYLCSYLNPDKSRGLFCWKLH